MLNQDPAPAYLVGARREEPPKDERVRPGELPVLNLPALLDRLNYVQAKGLDALIVGGRLIVIVGPVHGRYGAYEEVWGDREDFGFIGYGSTRLSAIEALFAKLRAAA